LLASVGKTLRVGRAGVAEEELVETKEQLLEELLEIVENLDHARDLKLIGGLPVLVSLLSSPHEGYVSGLQSGGASQQGAGFTRCLSAACQLFWTLREQPRVERRREGNEFSAGTAQLGFNVVKQKGPNECETPFTSRYHVVTLFTFHHFTRCRPNHTPPLAREDVGVSGA
jgi:hypothetical protein